MSNFLVATSAVLSTISLGDNSKVWKIFAIWMGGYFAAEATRWLHKKLVR